MKVVAFDEYANRIFTADVGEEGALLAMMAIARMTPDCAQVAVSSDDGDDFALVADQSDDWRVRLVVRGR